MSSPDFYANLPTFSDFHQLCDMGNYARIPDDWLIVITDIKGSTAAIRAGKYRDVNSVGVASIIATINAVKPLTIPFIFGGDGALLCVPPSVYDAVKHAVLGAKRLALEQFGLSLRVGMVPVADVRKDGYEVWVGKHQVSEAYVQAVFRGGGASHAETLLKESMNGHYRFELSESEKETADFSGYECRWQDVPSRHGEVMSLILTTQAAYDLKSDEIYKEVLAQIDLIYGSPADYCPLDASTLNLNARQGKLSNETKIRTSTQPRLSQLIYRLRLALVIRATRLITNLGIKRYKANWETYKKSVVANSDFRKFDDTLRMVISGTPDKREKLTNYLETQYQLGKIFYGTHTAAATLLTCMVFDYDANHFHFIDGSNGGYALAASNMKQQFIPSSHS
ncbi:MAG: hypothetical protein ACI9EW_000395 [Cellvibrionaceae bacterium]|jgi:hypothetical protein